MGMVGAKWSNFSDKEGALHMFSDSTHLKRIALDQTLDHYVGARLLFTGTKWTKTHRGKQIPCLHGSNYFAAGAFEVTISMF